MTSLGAGIDGAVRWQETTYDAGGRPFLSIRPRAENLKGLCTPDGKRVIYPLAESKEFPAKQPKEKVGSCTLLNPGVCYRHLASVRCHFGETPDGNTLV